MAAPTSEPSLLAGLLFDAQGERMSPSHATKRGTRYRYYVSRSLLDGTAKTSIGGQRIPAAGVGGTHHAQHREIGSPTPARFIRFIGNEVPDAIRQKRLIDRASKLAATWNDLSAETCTPSSVPLSPAYRFMPSASRSRWTEAGCCAGSMGNIRTRTDRRARDRSTSESNSVVISIPVRLRRAGKEMRLVVDDGSEQPHPDPALIRLVIRAHGIRDQLLHDRSLTLEEIAKSRRLRSLLRNPALPPHAARARHRCRRARRPAAAGTHRPQADGRHAPAARLERAETHTRICSAALIVTIHTRRSGGVSICRHVSPRSPEIGATRKRPPHHQKAKSRRARRDDRKHRVNSSPREIAYARRAAKPRKCRQNFLCKNHRKYEQYQ